MVLTLHALHIVATGIYCRGMGGDGEGGLISNLIRLKDKSLLNISCRCSLTCDEIKH